MAITRRQFLTYAGGSAAGAVIFQACGVPADELLVQSPVEMPEDMVSGLDNWYATVCKQCGSGEGIVVRVMEGRAKKVEGNVDHPINQGSHSVRCEAGLQSLYHPDRIRSPLVRVGERGSGQFREISWDDAIGRLSLQLKNLSESGKSNSAVMITDPASAHIGMIVDRFMSVYGGRHMGYEPLERTGVRRAIKQVFGQDVMPDFDIKNTNVLLSFGADFLNTWGSPVRYSRGYGEFRQGDRKRGTFYHVDSRFSMTAANADNWVYVKPGMEGILALSIAQVIVSEGLGDLDAARQFTENNSLDLDAFEPSKISQKVGVGAETIHHIAEDFANHGPSLAIGGGATGGHSNGLFNLTAIYALNYLVGSVNNPGGVVFNPAPVFEDVPVVPRVDSFLDFQRLVGDMKAGSVGALMVRNADVWHGLSDSSGFKDALFDVPLLVSFSGFMDDTTSMSDLVLPEHNYLEDWGSDIPDIGPGYQVLGIQQPVVRPFFESRGSQLGTRNFGDVLISLASELEIDLGLDAENFQDVVKNSVRELYDSNSGSVRSDSFAGFWNGLLQRGGWWDTAAIADNVSTIPILSEPQDPVFGGGEFHLIPFTTTGIGDGSGASIPWLQATPDPISTVTWQTWVEINMKDAERMGIEEGDVIEISSSVGSIEALAVPNPGAPPLTVGVPVGQGHRAGGRYAKDRGSNIYAILEANIDSASGALAWASTKVNISRVGRSEPVSKLENTYSEPPRDEEQLIIKITPLDS